MTRVLLALALVAIAIVVALIVEKRRPAPPTQPTWAVPSQVDRDDFDGTDKPWLVAVFTSATCATCADVWSKAAVLASDEVVVQEVEYKRDRALHDRYAIDAVPALAVADADGVVQRSVRGPVSATHLWAALAEVRGEALPPGCGATAD